MGNLPVSFDDVAQTEDSVDLTSPQQARIMMDEAPTASQTVKVIVAAEHIENSAFIGGITNDENDAGFE